MSYREAARVFDVTNHHSVAEWERIYLAEGPDGLYIERRGRGSKGRPTKFSKKVEEDLLKELQRLRAENAYLVNCKGNCYNNSVMENFFGHLKSELLYLQGFDSVDHFKAELIDYIDYYNNRRIKARLKGLPPALHRQQALSAA